MRNRGKNKGKITFFSVVLPFGIWADLFSKAIKGVKGSIQFHKILVTAPGWVEENIKRF